MRGFARSSPYSRFTPRTAALGAGWRRASRLTGRTVPLDVPAIGTKSGFPLDMGNNSAIVNTVDANAAPDQPPSTPDIAVPAEVWHSRSGFAVVFRAPEIPPFAPAPAATSVCGVTPFGLTS